MEYLGITILLSKNLVTWMHIQGVVDYYGILVPRLTEPIYTEVLHRADPYYGSRCGIPWRGNLQPCHLRGAQMADPLISEKPPLTPPASPSLPPLETLQWSAVSRWWKDAAGKGGDGKLECLEKETSRSLSPWVMFKSSCPRKETNKFSAIVLKVQKLYGLENKVASKSHGWAPKLGVPRGRTGKWLRSHVNQTGGVRGQ